MRLRSAVTSLGQGLDALAASRRGLFPWTPVLFSIGIGAYFALRFEPTAPDYLLAGGAVVPCILLRLFGSERLHLPVLALVLVLAGFLAAGARSHIVAAPVLAERYYGPVQGRIVDIDRSFSDQLRITLDRVALKVVAPLRTPAQVRVALHAPDAYLPEPGQTVRLTAHLSPPDGPVAPGGFDFQRIAWFERLGAVGYSRDPVVVLAEAEPGPGLWAFRLRMRLSRAMQARMEGQAGAFAAAMMTGDRSGVTQATNDALRASNLSHLISISGLHMGLLTGFVFAAVRYGLALAPPLALRLDTRKIAAVTVLLAATAYLAIAGPNVATRRAYIMAAVMLVAILCDRRAISLRSVAMAALVVLVLEPESLLGPGFQMSFGATVALILAFRHWRNWSGRIPAVLRPAAALCLSSLAAGTATAPIAAAHFNRIAEYGFAANLGAVPLMGLVVMPAGVVAAVLAPLGLAGPALWVMRAGTAAVLWIAETVAALDGAVVTVPTPGPWVLPLLCLGALVAAAGGGRWIRLGGTAAVALALLAWTLAERPVLRIASEGVLVGVRVDEGLALSKPKGGGFVASSWLEDDGDPADQEAAFARGLFSGKRGEMRASFGGRALWHLTGKTAPDRAGQVCLPGAIVVLDGYWQGGEPACRLFDARVLGRSGSLAAYLRGDGTLLLRSARGDAGQRPWNDRDLRADWLGN